MHFGVVCIYLVALANPGNETRATFSGALPTLLKERVIRLYRTDEITARFAAEAATLPLINGDYLGYRLGDIITHPSTDLNDIGQAWTKQFSRHAESGAEPEITLGAFTMALWPTSIGAELIRSRNGLRAVLSRRCLAAQTNRTVIHLRVGDQLEVCALDFESCSETRTMRPSTLSGIASQLKSLQRNIVQQPVVFIAGIHRARNMSVQNLRKAHALSMRYISTVERVFRQQGYRCSLQSQSPDDDFCAMYTANLLVPTGSAFSRRAAEVTLGRVLETSGSGRAVTVAFRR
tara:strand:- start:1899 stop:2771 length:873 start_codon:yes stop_codon:yes gene_type:complete